MKQILMKTRQMKNTFLMLLMLLVGSSGWGQTTIFQFNFDAGSTPSTDNAVGTPSFSKIGTFSSPATTACNGVGGIQDAAWNMEMLTDFK